MSDIKIIDELNYIEYELNKKVNYSNELANDVLIHNRNPKLKNNILNINGQFIDMYDYTVINNYLKPYEFSLIATSGQFDTWYVRKTSNHKLEFYHFDYEDNFTQHGLFHYFIAGYKQRLTL